MTETITQQQLEAALIARHGRERWQRLQSACVGIAGLGGLGSNIAVQLTRLGIGRLILADYDRVELSNLNRQNYRFCDVGKPKTDALTEQLRQINPYLACEPQLVRLTPQNIPTVFAGCQIICEAFDDPEQKGVGSANTITTSRRLSRLYLCGDGTADIATDGSLLAPRVSVCAAHAATMVMRLALGLTTP